MSYNTASYGMMIRDSVRLNAFTAALRRTIEPGVTTVLDIGTGTGIMAFVAAKAGAKRTYGIEPAPAIEVAREIVRINDLSDRIELHKAMSTDVDLPPCDVVISDLRGRMPLFQAHVPTIIDARQRLLKPGGRLIAARDEVFALPVQADETWKDGIGYWDDNIAAIDMTPAKRITANGILDFDRKVEHALSEPVKLHEIDYYSVETPHLHAASEVRITRNGRFHGLSLWFDIVLDEQTRLNNGLGEPRLVYGRPFLPVMQPFDVREGEHLEFEIRGQLVRSDYVWSWSGGVAGDSDRSFSQTTFDGADVTPEEFARFRLQAKPQRSAHADWVSFVLGAMDGDTSIASLAEQLHAAQPAVGTRDEAIGLVSAVVAQYARTD